MWNPSSPSQPNSAQPTPQPVVQKEERLLFLVEDDLELQTSLSFNLQQEGYAVKCFAKAEELLYFLEVSPKLQPLGFVVDVNLAGAMNGMECVKSLRKEKRFQRLPVLMLTAKAGHQDVVAGLDDGADDYLPKPFDMGVFFARLRACLRRSEYNTGPIQPLKKKLSLSGIDVDPISHEVKTPEKDVPLTATEYGLLTALMSKPNEVMSRDDLLLRLVGPNKTITARTVDVHIRALRAKLGKKARHISTVRGFGYKFVA